MNRPQSHGWRERPRGRAKPSAGCARRAAAEATCPKRRQNDNRSSIDLSENWVERADHHDQVGNEVSGGDAFERLEVVKARRTRADAVRSVFAVADDVIAELAARR